MRNNLTRIVIVLAIILAACVPSWILRGPPQHNHPAVDCGLDAGVDAHPGPSDAGGDPDAMMDASPSIDSATDVGGPTMAIIQLSPNAIVSESNFSAVTLEAISDDPYSPDGTLVAPDVATTVANLSVRFVAPPGWSAGSTQTIAVYVKQTTDWESGGRPLVSITCSGSSLLLQPITDEGTLLELTFDGTAVVDPNDIQCDLVMQNTVQGAVLLGAMAWKTETVLGAGLEFFAPGTSDPRMAGR